MELYITWSFWMMVIVMVLRLLVVSIADYPRVEKKTLGADIVGIFISLGFIAWAGFLLYA